MILALSPVTQPPHTKPMVIVATAPKAIIRALAVSGVGGTLGYLLFHQSTATALTIWHHWFTSDAIGIIAVAPLLIGFVELAVTLGLVLRRVLPAMATTQPKLSSSVSRTRPYTVAEAGAIYREAVAQALLQRKELAAPRGPVERRRERHREDEA